MRPLVDFDREGSTDYPGPEEAGLTVMTNPVIVNLPPAASTAYGAVVRHDASGTYFKRGFTDRYVGSTRIWYQLTGTALFQYLHPAWYRTGVVAIWIAVLGGLGTFIGLGATR